jgi:hypothetical protein
MASYIYANAFTVTDNPATRDQDMNGNAIRGAAGVEAFSVAAVELAGDSIQLGPDNKVTLSALGINTPQNYNFPSDPGASGQFLALTGGSGQLTWVSGAPSGGVESLNTLIGAVGITSNTMTVSGELNNITIELNDTYATIQELGAVEIIASNAETIAYAAQGTADQAALDASGAQATADQAILDASGAQATADQAVLDASGAQATADQAILDAANALGAALVADGDAKQAIGDAATAQGAADAAQGTADQALTNANGAVTAAQAANNNLANLITYLESKLMITPTGQTTITPLTYTALESPSLYVPSESPPIPTTEAPAGWRFTKAAGGSGGNAKINWFMFNPLWPTEASYPPGSPAPSPNFNRNQLRSVWAKVHTQNQISVGGVIYFNIYTLDYNAGSSSFYTNRWSYSMNLQAMPTSTAVPVLAAGYTYLLYAWDAPKNIATPSPTTNIAMANGQFPLQTRPNLCDPYDIELEIPHIALGAVAFNATPTPQPAVPIFGSVTGISIETTSSNVTPALDFTVQSFGYTVNGATERFNLQYS